MADSAEHRPLRKTSSARPVAEKPAEETRTPPAAQFPKPAPATKAAVPSTADADDERRRATRLRSRTLTDGRIQSSEQRGLAFLGSTVNLSLGGALLRTYEALEAGMKLALHFRLPEGDVEAIGTVQHVDIDPIGCRLAGVRFDPLPNDVLTLLSAHLHGVEPTAISPAAEAAKLGSGVVSVSGRIQGGRAS